MQGHLPRRRVSTLLGACRAEVSLWFIRPDGGVLQGIEGRVPLQQALWPQEELWEAQVQ